jgi:Ca-activated chloride channel homolog
MALAPVSVLDLNGRNVTGLVRDNFRLLDGKKPREIAAFAQEDQPLTMGLVFDCSRSMLDKSAVAREAPAQLYRSRRRELSDHGFRLAVAAARLDDGFQ